MAVAAGWGARINQWAFVSAVYALHVRVTPERLPQAAFCIFAPVAFETASYYGGWLIRGFRTKQKEI